MFRKDCWKAEKRIRFQVRTKAKYVTLVKIDKVRLSLNPGKNVLISILQYCIFCSLLKPYVGYFAAISEA